MSTLKLSELKRRLQEKGISSKGNKAELMKRLLESGGDIAEYGGEGAAIVDSEEEHETEETDRRGDEQALPAMSGLMSRELDMLRREELAEREVQLLRREMDLLRVSQREGSVQSNGRSSNTKLKDVGAMLGDFDGNGQNYNAWEKQIRCLARNFSLEDLEIKAVICNKLKGKALKWYYSRTDCVELNSEDLLRELRGMFDLRPSKLSLRREFEERKWKLNETFTDYVHDKVTLGNLVPITEDELIDYLIEGIPDTSLQVQARIQQFKTIANLSDAFSKVNLRDIVTTSKANRPRKTVPAVQREESNQKRKTEKKHRCYNCNELGHFISDCKRPKREKGSCYRCGEHGHLAKECSNSGKGDISYIGKQPANEFHRILDMQVYREDGGIQGLYQK